MLDGVIYTLLDTLVRMYSWARGYYFPKNYLRRWKLDILHEVYEQETTELFKRIIQPGMTVIDIGAHLGYFTRIFSRLVGPTGRVYAFEADPENFKLLEKNTHHLTNVYGHQVALGDATGTIDFYHYDEKAGCHSTLPNVPLAYAKRKISVQATTLDTFLKGEGEGRKINLIKMDIEGGETAALDGMSELLCQPQISLVFEFAPEWIRRSGSDPLAMLKKLTSSGFQLFAIEKSLTPLSAENDADYLSHIPKTETHYNEFINIYCVKEQPQVTRILNTTSESAFHD